MRRWLCAAVLSLLPFAAAEATVPVALFKTAEIRAETHDGLKQWQAVLQRIRAERPIYEACRRDASACPSRGVAAWQQLLTRLQDKPLDEQVIAVNRFANQWRYRNDNKVYGRSDYWASPLQFTANSGDCEDYAIMKYVSLRLLGVPDERLRLAVVQDEIRGLAHAVLVVYKSDTAVVLDNLTNAILPHDRITHYSPYYTVNETLRWAHVPSSEIMMSAAAGDTLAQR